MALGTSFTQVTKSGLSSTSAYNTGHINSSGIITATKFVGTLEGNVTSDDWTNTATGISTTVNVGIGTTNATSKLTISDAIVKQIFTATNTYAANDTTQCGYQSQNLSDTTNTYSALRLTAGSNSPATAQIASIRKGTGQNDLAIQLETGNTAFEALRITSAGKVGIGTDAPVNTLHLHGNTSGTGPILQLSNDTGDCRLFFGTHSTTGDANAQGQIRYNVQNNHLTAYTAGSERVRITSAGKIVIHGGGATGANNTATILENGNTLNIHGTSSSDGISVVRYSADYGAYGINIGKSRNSTFGTNTLVQDGNELGHISFYGADGTDFEMAAQITAKVDGDPATGGDGTDMPGSLSFRTTPEGADSPTEKLRINSDGNVTINDGDLVIGTGGHGIDFSAQTTSTAAGAAASTSSGDETLDHYEKGDWDPTIYGHLGGGSFTVSSRDGRYVKVGDLVSVWGSINWTGTGGNGVVNIAGLPFTPYNVNANNSAVVIGSRSGVSYPRVIGQMYHTGYINLQYIDASSPYNTFNVSVGALQSSGQLRFRLQYQAA